MLAFLALVGCNGGSVVTGDGNYALAFEGSGCVDVDLDAAARSNDLTIEATLRGAVDASFGEKPLIVWPGVFALVELEDGRFAFGLPDDPGAGLYSTDSLIDGTIHHVAATWAEDGTVELWVDGSSLGFGSLSADDSPSNSLHIGCWPEHDTGWEGVIDEVRLSSSVRYDDDFDHTYNTFETDAATVSLWHMNEGEGEVVLDDAGRYDGVVRNADWIDFAGAQTED